MNRQPIALILSLVFLPLSLWANTAPKAVIVSAVLREGTALMDITYRVSDPDDATVSAYPLAFVKGVRSFATVIRPVTFEEDTGSHFGPAMASNTHHHLVWNVGADWKHDPGQVRFEIQCRDSGGLLSFQWLTLPARGDQAALAISENAPRGPELLDALFWLHASGDAGLVLERGILRGSERSGAFRGIALASGTTPGGYAAAYVLQRMNLDAADESEVADADSARLGIESTGGWHAVRRPFRDVAVVSAWGYLPYIKVSGIREIASMAAGNRHCLFLLRDGSVRSFEHFGWGEGRANVPAGLGPVKAVAAGADFSLALKSDGTVVGWGGNDSGQTDIPADLVDVIAISAGRGDCARHALALQQEGTVVAWGENGAGQATVPAGLTNVIAIAAGDDFSLALKRDGTVVGWGNNDNGRATPPPGLTHVVAIAAGQYTSYAVRSDGTVVAWGGNRHGQTNVPAACTNVVAVAAGEHCLALRRDGSVVAWGFNNTGQTEVPRGIRASMVAAGKEFSIALSMNEP